VVDRRRPRRAAVLSTALLAGALPCVAIPGADEENAALEPATLSVAPLGSGVVPPLPLPGRSADPDRLLEAWSFFATPPRDLVAGPYHLLTDVEDPVLESRIAEAATSAEPLYVARYGVAPLGRAAETIVLYRREDDYRRLQDRAERIRGLTSRGHVGWGMVVLFAPEEGGDDAAATVLRHELAHLLNRRSLGPALPPWLDEGLADDFAALEERLESLRTVDGNRTEIRGALASLDLLARAIATGRMPPLESLLGLDWEAFVEEPAAELHYAASAWLVRYLLDDRSGLGSAFHSFLRRVSRGGGVGARDLELVLRRPWVEIESGWRRYVVGRALAAGVGSMPAS
jgi:hypothetical protein